MAMTAAVDGVAEVLRGDLDSGAIVAADGEALKDRGERG